MVTIKDVAKEAGLAVGTVSRILNNRGYISEASRMKVKAATEKLNYQPNEMARSLKKRSSNMIGVIVPQIAHPYFALLISSLEEAAYKHDYRILLLNSQGLPKKENEFIDLCYRNQVMGIVLCNGNMDISKSERFSVPVITIERKMEGGDASIECANEAGGRLAAEHLIERGCRKLLHISGHTDPGMPAEKRGQGFEEACKQAGLACRIVTLPFEDYRLKEASQVLDTILTDNPEVDGIFASDDILAAEVIKACSRRGIRVPEDMKIVGFDDTDIASIFNPGITTIHQPLKEMAEQVVSMIGQMADKQSVPAQTVLPVKLIQRESS